MKKFIILFLFSFCLLSCSSSSLTQAEDSALAGDQRLDQSPNVVLNVDGTPDEVQLQQSEEQDEETEGYQSDNSVDGTLE